MCGGRERKLSVFYEKPNTERDRAFWASKFYFQVIAFVVWLPDSHLVAPVTFPKCLAQSFKVIKISFFTTHWARQWSLELDWWKQNCHFCDDMRLRKIYHWIAAYGGPVMYHLIRKIDVWMSTSLVGGKLIRRIIDDEAEREQSTSHYRRNPHGHVMANQ